MARELSPVAVSEGWSPSLLLSDFLTPPAAWVVVGPLLDRGQVLLELWLPTLILCMCW